MKRCLECGEVKPLDEYYVYRRPGRETIYARCKVCHAARLKNARPPERAREVRESHRVRMCIWVDEQKQAPCTDCGVQYPPYVMDFDHVHGTKFKNIAKMVARHTKQELIDEIAKCELVCSNCHRIRTHKRKEQEF